MNQAPIRQPDGFPWGTTFVASIGEPNHDTGINFGILRLRQNESFSCAAPFETALLLMSGKVSVRLDGTETNWSRRSLFDENPTVVHLPAQAQAVVIARTDAELAMLQVENSKPFEAKIFAPGQLLESEHRGKGKLEDTSYRIVRTVFDKRNRPESQLVLGEVINFQGRWSSYPPHHHPQPEIYHYRFSLPQGYGHAELGEQVFKVRSFDTIKIFAGQDHSQVSAPGYAMYYLWAIRHLPGDPYLAPEFTTEHRWTMEPK